MYKVTEQDLKGDLEGFPPEVVQRMIECQVEQDNKAEVRVFQGDNMCGKTDGGFDWRDSGEGDDFWDDVIVENRFDLFFSKYPKVTRVEVIDQNGRSYVNWDENNKVELQYQDEGRTLKIFIKRETNG